MSKRFAALAAAAALLAGAALAATPTPALATGPDPAVAATPDSLPSPVRVADRTESRFATGRGPFPDPFVRMLRATGGDAQVWRLRPVSTINGGWLVVNESTGGCLQPSRTSDPMLINVIERVCLSTDPEVVWQFRPDPDSLDPLQFTVFNVALSACLTHPAPINVGQFLTITRCNATDTARDQIFRLDPV